MEDETSLRMIHGLTRASVGRVHFPGLKSSSTAAAMATSRNVRSSQRMPPGSPVEPRHAPTGRDGQRDRG